MQERFLLSEEMEDGLWFTFSHLASRECCGWGQTGDRKTESWLPRNPGWKRKQRDLISLGEGDKDVKRGLGGRRAW